MRQNIASNAFGYVTQKRVSNKLCYRKQAINLFFLLREIVGPEFDILIGNHKQLFTSYLVRIVNNFSYISTHLLIYPLYIRANGTSIMLMVLPPCVKLFIFHLQPTSLHLAQVNHAIQQGINVSGYNSPFAKLSKNATFFFCKVDCCNILSKYAIRTRRNLHIDQQHTPKKEKKKKS